LSEEIKIRQIDRNTKKKLKAISKKSIYPSFNQFMLVQLERIVNNNGLDLLQNMMAADIERIKRNQSAILEGLIRSEIQKVELLNRLDILNSKTERWLQFILEVEAIEQKRKVDH
jgi:hypothetical protein